MREVATTREIHEVWTALTMAYPYFGRNDQDKPKDPRELAQTLKLYEQMLSDVDGSALVLAAKAHMAASRFFPTIHDLRQAAIEISLPRREPAIVAWGDVMAAQTWAWPGRYQEVIYSVRDTAGLPPMPEMIVRQDLGGEPPFRNPLTAQACRILGGWRAIMASECPAAERARFVEAYEALVARERDEALMLPEVRERQQIGAGAEADLVSRVAGQLAGGR
jgi:hypothetical protein